MTGTTTKMHGVKDAGRKSYAPPRLTVYGDLRVMTLTNVSMNMNDPGNSSTSRT
ncbi:MAG TPA: hypothetical protein VLK84_20395 [Longimicrobium sp.]|nr:hypothetical protein [Longimicrobium sp.]